ncbi:MAG: molybdopterin-dependent oxidoreductase [Ignavibacteriales bacterium]|nr:molybdopterin-dependent oxidoreductase [Ignavibacteriales bacterium]
MFRQVLKGLMLLPHIFLFQNDRSAYLLGWPIENGQGLRTTFSIIAAEVLGIPADKIYYLRIQDTGLIPDSGPTDLLSFKH